MHRHDLDLMAALADGSLEDETQARARLDTCEDCRLEYEAQTQVLAALNTVPVVAMTDHEKAALHRDLWTTLRTEGAPAAASSPWWYRWSYAAAGLFVVVGLAGVLSQIGGDDSDDRVAESFSEIGSGLDGGASPNATTAGATADDAAAEEAGVDLAPQAFFQDQTSILKTRRSSGQALNDDEAGLHQMCIDDSGLEDYVAVEEYSIDAGDYVAAVHVDAPPDSDEISFVNLETCEVVYPED